MCFLGHFLPQKVKMSIKALITVKDQSGNSPQNPIMEDKLGLIHFTEEFVRKMMMPDMCVFPW
jgi:hypothetical protein